MKSRSTALMVSALVLSLASPALAHRDGCHRWHSCPSDSGSYVCGDLGHASECGGSVPEVEVEEAPQHVVPQGPTAAELAERARAEEAAAAAAVAREAAAGERAAAKKAAEAAARLKAELEAEAEAEAEAKAQAAAEKAAEEAAAAAEQAAIVERARSAFAAATASPTSSPTPSPTASPTAEPEQVTQLDATKTSGEDEGNPFVGFLILGGGAWFVMRKVRKRRASV